MTLTTLDLILIAVAIAAIGFVVWSRLGVAAQMAKLQAEAGLSDALRAERDALRLRAETAERERASQAATMSEREEGHARELARLQLMQTESEARFKTLASAALADTQKTFVELAQQTLKQHHEGAKGELGEMLKPIEETFGKFREKVEQIEKVRSEDRAKLDEQLRAVGETTRLTREVTGKLQTALTGSKGGGRWGEETLRNVLEIAGLSPYADFIEQTGTSTETGRIRPDAIIRLPGGRHLVVDSKVSLVDYLAASEETDVDRAKQKLRDHAARVRSHVTALSRKDYWKEIPATVDFVAMFIPGENFYAAVLEHDRDIFDYAAKNNVVIVTPSTLIALAKSVAYGWRQEQMAKNAEQAKNLGQELYDRMVKFSEHMARVGNGLGNASKAYNDMVGSFESRVLPSARKFEELSFADGGKSIPDVQQVDVAPRQMTLLDMPADAPAAAPASARRK